MADCDSPPGVGVVVIGRNEGDRLLHCIATLPTGAPAVYVDSGSSDGSPASARNLGLEVVELSSAKPFSAARARNEGLARLSTLHPGLRFVQMLDGDCLLCPGWLHVGATFLAGKNSSAVVFGNCREAHPEQSIYNTLCDVEWRTPLGEVDSCGGNALMRIAAFSEMQGYDAALIAGEEPDLCYRLRSSGWKIDAVNFDMVRHDAAITRFNQWAKRTLRSGFAYAQLVHRHGILANKTWDRALLSMFFWGALIPAITLLTVCAALWGGNSATLTIVFSGVILLNLIQIARMVLKTREHRSRATM